MRLELLRAAACALALAATASHAQIFTDPAAPDWHESDAPPPPALRIEGLIGIEMPGSQLRFGVDPKSIVIGANGVVNYVVVASSTSGAVNGIYEGVHCASGKVRVHARFTPGSGWTTVKDAPWRDLHEQGMSRHSLVIARNGACMGQGPGTSAEQIARDLAGGGDRRFRNETR